MKITPNTEAAEPDISTVIVDFSWIALAAFLLYIIVYFDKIVLFFKQWRRQKDFEEKTDDTGHIVSNIPYENNDDNS